MDENNCNQKWKLLLEFLKERLKDPWYQPSFIFYFVFIVLGIGSFGLFYDIVNLDYGCNLFSDDGKIDTVLMNMTNIGLSLTSASVIELIFISKSKLEREGDLESNSRFFQIKRDVRFLGISVLVLEFLLWILVNTIFEIFFIRIVLGTVSLILSYIIWWVSNARNKILIKTKNNVKNTMGGSVSDKPLKGSTNGYKVV